MKKAMRFNEGKPPLSLVPLRALEGVAEVFKWGAKKYKKDNWRQGFDSETLLDSALRHISKIQEGEEFDSESGLRHSAHALWNLLVLEHQQIVKKEEEIKINNKKEQLVYISGAYSNGNREQNTLIAELWAEKFWELGTYTIVPHSLTHNISQRRLRNGNDFPYEFYIASDLHILERCDAIAMLPDYESSKGAMIEMEHAKKLGIPVIILEEAFGKDVVKEIKMKALRCER